MEVIVKNCKSHPVCPHGPCLLFERHSTDGTKTGRKFFACSACRDRSDCNFFHWIDDEFSIQKKMHWEQIIEKSKPPYNHEEYMKRLSMFEKLPLSERSYCKTCSLLTLPEKDTHQDHDVIPNVSTQHLLQPTSLFQSLENKKAEAQYFFSEKTVQFVTKLLSKLGFSKLLLIGVPKIHEHVMTNANESMNVSTFLMDIDYRYMQFFEPEHFCHYNLFNNHFFGGNTCKRIITQFLSEEDGRKVAVLIDPPFGGLIDAISYSLQKINKWWRNVNSKENSETLPLLWFFPYFLEPRIIKNFPNLVMMDYKVEYMNHKKFGTNVSSKGSPVRIFTNIPAASFTLPKSEGYRFCKQCEKFVSKENLHCVKCNACTTKHGSTYKHCDNCQRCVKNSYVHCDRHNKCSPKLISPELESNCCSCKPNQDEKNDYEKCFKCFGYGHRKRNCPTNQKSSQVRLMIHAQSVDPPETNRRVFVSTKL